MDGIAQELPAPLEPANREDSGTADRALPRTARDAAFSALVERHARFLYRVAFGLLRHAHDAEDAVQETLMKLYRSETWLQLEDEKAFLAAAVWRTGLNRLSSAQARAMKNSTDIADLELAAATPTPEADALSASARATMRRLIDALPETLRQPLVLSAVEGMRSRDVAAILNIPDATVRTRILRAKTELRRRFLLAEGARS